MVPSVRYKKLVHHVYHQNKFKLLKMGALYGANAAGKSNLIKALQMLQDLILGKHEPASINHYSFKFHLPDETNSQIFGIEFFQNGIPYYYGLEIKKGIVLREELYQSGLGKKDSIIFERITGEDKKIMIQFNKKSESNKEGRILNKIIEQNLAKPDALLLILLGKIQHPGSKDCKNVMDWFKNNLVIIDPDSQPSSLAYLIDMDKNFRNYVKNIVCSLNTGISNIRSEKKTLTEKFGTEKANEIISKLNEADLSSDIFERPFPLNEYGEIVIQRENNEWIIKQLILEHSGKEEHIKTFSLDEESDGTVRLLEFIPAFKNIVDKSKVYVIDEIERSIHPLMVKELVSKFSLDEHSRGQLIFSTHESNLLDLNLLRQDEIWFAEKDQNGCTDLYSLSDFKEHHTIDIRKGYLNGRYGSIPFLSNLKDLDWHAYDPG